MNYGAILSNLRKQKGLTPSKVVEYINANADTKTTTKSLSRWEMGTNSPSLEYFVLLCELYEVEDVVGLFRGHHEDFRDVRVKNALNTLGQNRMKEYMSFLLKDPRFVRAKAMEKLINMDRTFRIYDIPAAAGAGHFLDSYSYEEVEVDYTVPEDADFGVRVSGDSMTPRFVDKQIVYVKGQSWVDVGEIGVFALNGSAYIKKLGEGEWLSLNPEYSPIKLSDDDALHVFGKVMA